MALGKKLDRKRHRVCRIAAPKSILGREALRAQELPAAKDDVTALPSTPKMGMSPAASGSFNPATPRAQILYSPLLRTLPAFRSRCYRSRAWPDKQLIVPEPPRPDGNRQSTRPLARSSFGRDAYERKARDEALGGKLLSAAN